MDALQAAPASHRLLLDNDRVRVLEVVIEPRTREPEHISWMEPERPHLVENIDSRRYHAIRIELK
jgi:hypothetical protein